MLIVRWQHPIIAESCECIETNSVIDGRESLLGGPQLLSLGQQPDVRHEKSVCIQDKVTPFYFGLLEVMQAHVFKSFTSVTI